VHIAGNCSFLVGCEFAWIIVQIFVVNIQLGDKW